MDGRLVHICHYPMMEWHNSFHGSYLVFGHIHNSVSSPFLEAISGNEHMLNAGVDLNYFQPVTFEELVRNNAEFYGRKEPKKQEQLPVPYCFSVLAFYPFIALWFYGFFAWNLPFPTKKPIKNRR